MKKNKKIIGLILGFVAVALIFFLIGRVSGKNKTLVAGDSGKNNFGQMMNREGQNNQKGVTRGNGNVFGTILSKDANSITVELRAMGPNTGSQGQGSKIVFYTDKTTVVKTVDGVLADLAVGKEISVSGTANPDGSVNASSIQLKTAPIVPAQIQ